jgi:choline monooxygenase
VPLTWGYKHLIYYPSVMMMHTGLVSVAETTIPLAPDRTRVLVKLFCYPGPAGTFRARLLYRGLKTFASSFFTKVAGEDAGIMPRVHRGLNSRRHPGTGLISIREERLHHFQDYIRRMTLDEADGLTGCQAVSQIRIDGGHSQNHSINREPSSCQPVSPTACQPTL